MLQPTSEIQDIIDSQPNWKGEVLSRLRTAILGCDAGISEVVKWRKRSNPLGSVSFEKNGIICVQDYLKSAVRLTFPKGARLIDPDGLFNCRLDSKTSRGIDIFEGDEISLSSLEALVGLAVEANTNTEVKK
ncbi:MAG: hypothetical protein RL198_837 [Actinomycetota bacterium]